MITVRYINELRLGNILDEDFPTFCYEFGICNPENLKLGLFKGLFLQHVRNTISSEHKHSIVFITDFSSNLHWASICFEWKAWSRFKEEVQRRYHWSDTGDTSIDCLCSRSSKSYPCIICSTVTYSQNLMFRHVFFSVTRRHGTSMMGCSVIAIFMNQSWQYSKRIWSFNGSRRCSTGGISESIF